MGNSPDSEFGLSARKVLSALKLIIGAFFLVVFVLEVSLLPAQASGHWRTAVPIDHVSYTYNFGSDGAGAALFQLEGIWGPCVVLGVWQQSPLIYEASGTRCPVDRGAIYTGAADFVCDTGTIANMCIVGPSAHQGCPCKRATAGDPINVLSGNNVQTATDFTTQGSNALSLQRTYNSDLNYLSPGNSPYSPAETSISSRFGYAWRSQYDAFIRDTLNGALSSSTTDVDAIRPDGSPVHFQKESMTGIWYTAYWDFSTNKWSTADSPPQYRYDVDYKFAAAGSNWTITDNNDTVETYDSTGKLISIAYRGGYTQTLTYDGYGNNTVVSDSLGRSLTFHYTGAGLVDYVTDASGGVTNYGYVDQSNTPGLGLTTDSRSNWVLKTITFPDSTPTTPVVLTYIYDAFDPNNTAGIAVSAPTGGPTAYYNTTAINRFALTGIIDENGHRYATWTYDATTGRATSSQHAGGADLTTVSYDDVNNRRVVTNALGKVFQYTLGTFQGQLNITSIHQQATAHTPFAAINYAYDGYGHLQQKTSGEGRVTTYEHNPIGEETKRTDGSGNIVSTVWNSSFHVPDEIVQPNLTTDFSYFPNGQLQQITQTDTTTYSPAPPIPPYKTRNFTYYSSGLLKTDSHPLCIVSTSPAPTCPTVATTTYAYDAHGYISSIQDPVLHTISITATNGFGEPTTSVDPNGVTTSYTYDPRGRLKTMTINPTGPTAVYSLNYDLAGNLHDVTFPDSSMLTYTYDNAHRLISIVNNIGETMSFALNKLNDETSRTITTSSAAIVKKQTATFDELGRMLSRIGAMSQTTMFGYDKDDNQTSTTDARSKGYIHSFDLSNRLDQEEDPDTYLTKVTYNGKNELLSVTDARNLTTSYMRDGFGNILQHNSPDSGTSSFEYDADGNIAQQIDARGVVTDFVYDAADRIISKKVPGHSENNIIYTYDMTSGSNEGIGHLTKVIDPAGTSLFVFDALGHVTSEARTYGTHTYTTRYTSDSAGNLLTSTSPSGRIVTYGRDVLGRISSVTTQQNSSSPTASVASSLSYLPFGSYSGATFGNGVIQTLGFDLDYEIHTINAVFGTNPIQNLTYTPDPVDNLTSIADAVAPSRSQILTYDDLNRLWTATGSYGSQSYTYDQVGNRLTRTVGATSEVYSYSPTSNRLGAITTGSNIRSLTYRASGELAQDVRDPSDTFVFTQNKYGRLSSIALNGATSSAYLYDAFEQRVQKIVGGVTTDYIFDRFGHLLFEANDSTGALQKEYIWLDDLPVAIVDDTGASPYTYYIQADHLGTPQKITDASATIVWDGVFDPFGNPMAITGTLANNLRFRGQYFDSETVLNQNWHRDYDPSIGRYIESDLRGFWNNFNNYGYIGQNPFAAIDPTGRTDNRNSMGFDPDGKPYHPTPDWPSSGTIYGNWCGGDWTGGYQATWTDLTAAQRARARAPIDPLDDQCERHDKCYDRCRGLHPCTPSNRHLCFKACDFALAKAAWEYGGFFGNEINFGISNNDPDPGPNSSCCKTRDKDDGSVMHLIPLSPDGSGW